MGQDQHICPCRALASGRHRFRRRLCLRKGCGRIFQPRRWNQRYCQDPACLRLVRRWQAAKRQRQRRQNAEHRQGHCEAERRRRKERRDRTRSTRSVLESARSGEKEGAWSRSKASSGSFCDRPGCYDAVRCSIRARARYCTDPCAQAMRRVFDRERKWLGRKTYAGRFKRRLEYQHARRKRAGEPDSPSGSPWPNGAEGESFGPQLFGFS